MNEEELNGLEQYLKAAYIGAMTSNGDNYTDAPATVFAEYVMTRVKSLLHSQDKSHTQQIALSDSERFDYNRLKALEVKSIDDYQKFKEDEPNSPKRIAAWIHQLSPWNLERGVEALRERDQQIALKAKNEVIEWLEADLKRLDSRNWTMETLALDTLIGSGKADEYQIGKRQQIVEDRRAAHALYAILNNYKATLKAQKGK